MPFTIIREDIARVRADAIVNSANPQPVVGAGTDEALHSKAGPRLLKARQRIGSIQPGQAALTPAYGLDSRYVIHTVGPVWIDGNHGEQQLLRSCYDNALRLAAERKCRSIAFPLISSGNYGFPKDKALQVAIAAFSAFLMENEMQIYLVVFDRGAYRLSEQLFQGVASYIDQHYVDQCETATYGMPRRQRRRLDRCMEVCESMAMPRPSMSLEDFLKAKDSGFSQRLLELIQEKGLKNSAVYKRANISKQLFSKIINDPDARPTKPTAIALALALELDLEGTRDLIGRAGYALTNSSTFDLIIRYFIERKEYNVVQINIALYEFDQSLLGAG